MTDEKGPLPPRDRPSGGITPIQFRPAFLWGPVALQMALIFIASSISDVPQLPGGMSDKSGHSIGYALLGGLLLRALAGGRLSGVTSGRAAAAVVLASLYGVSDEFHQWFVPGRTADPFDALADAIGATVAVVAIGAAAVARAWGILKFSSRSRGSP